MSRDPPYVGGEGNDPWGAPLRRPDRGKIVEVLRASDFAELERWFTHWQQEFTDDPRKEPSILVAFAAFAVADPSLGPLLDAWVAASPQSFISHAARGSWSTAMGYGVRGSDTIDKTPPEQLEAMHVHHGRAVVDLNRAIALRPDAITAHVDLLTIMKANGVTNSARPQLDAAVAACPTCYEPRAQYLTSLFPRWGGSYAQIDAFVESVEPSIAKNPKLALLRGFVAWDRCRIATADDDLAAATRFCDDALRHGDEPRFLTSRARLHRKAKRDGQARVDLDRTLELAPQHIEARVTRYYLRRDAGDLLGAGEDLVTAYRLDAHDPNVIEAKTWMIQKLRYEGDTRSKSGGHDEAAKYFDLAVALAPQDDDLRKRQTWNAGLIGPDELARRVAAAPDDFEARLLLDHALAKSNRFPEVIASWDEYLRRNPDDARAHRERGGAKFRLGKHDEGIADAQRACDLGEPQACEDVPKMRARAARSR